MPKIMSRDEFMRHIREGEAYGVTRSETYDKLKSNGWSLEGDLNPPLENTETNLGSAGQSLAPAQGRFAKIGEEFSGAFQPKEGIRGAIPALAGAEAGLRIAGQGAGMVGDVIGKGLGFAGKVASAVTPDFIEKPVKQVGVALLQSPLGQKALSAISQGQEMWQSFEQEHPDAAKDIGAVVNIASLLPIGKGTKAVGQPIKQEIQELGREIATKNTIRAVAGLDDVIEKGIAKGIRPTVRGKQGIDDLVKFNTKAKEAVKTIVEQKDSLKYIDDIGEEIVGGTPKNLMQFGQAIEQAKKNVFNEYSSLTKQAGQAGISIDLTDVANKLDDVAKSKSLQLGRPEVAVAAKRAAERFRRAGRLAPEDTENLIKELNQSLQSFYTSGAGKSQAQVDASIASALRSKLDDAIEGATGKEYQALKNKYGSLKAIEKDVVNRALVDARKNAKGLIDFTDIFTGGDIIAGLATMNPALALKGGVGMAIKKIFKGLNEPNRVIRKMFEQVDEVMERAGKRELLNLTPEEKALGMIGGSDKIPLGISQRAKNVIKIFEESKDQKVIGSAKGKKFELGSFGKSTGERKIAQADRFAETELPETIKNIKTAYRASNDATNYRSGNTAWVAEMPDGETRIIYTRKNKRGIDEILNWHSLNEEMKDNYLATLKSFGPPKA